ncbi:MAG: pyruvate, phosphate dikinase [Alphaproteobacteria bacterium]
MSTPGSAPDMAKDTSPKRVYRFGGGVTDGVASMKALLGGKGANLAEMCNLGLPVPPGFTLTTQVCGAFNQAGGNLPAGLDAEIIAALSQVGTAVDASFGDAQNPLLVSIRSGGRASMPGMMDTILNLGLNDVTVEGLAARSGDPRFAYDSYRRFIQMYANVVLGAEMFGFEDLLEEHKTNAGYTLDTEMTSDDWRAIVSQFKELVQSELGLPFPQNVHDQLWGAIGAVFGSWANARAITYRRLNDIPDDWGTAVNVQAMVFGNLGNTSATGVAFTRDPSTGDNHFFGEYLVNAQGEDVVAGIRTPHNITERARKAAGSSDPSLETIMPAVFSQLTGIFQQLEGHYGDMQDIEFTVQDGTLWMLQTRSGKRTTKAAIKIAVDMANEGLIETAQAVMRIKPASLDQLLHPTLDPTAKRTIIATGLPASPGAACGELVFSADEAEKRAADGAKVILARIETSPEDIHGMHAAVGILTTRGGMTSHAAVVARGMGRPCVSGAGALRIDYGAQEMIAAGVTLKAGDLVTIDGTTGQVIAGQVATVRPELSAEFNTLMGWADGLRKMAVRTNAETVQDAQTALKFGAQGIGLCRTEHMFFDPDRIVAMREMILARDEAGRRAALQKILPMQRKDFVDLFVCMDGMPVTVRLLDPPLHEFLPHTDTEIAEVAATLGVDAARLRERIDELAEVNPMLGHRGCRLAISYPEIPQTQARAIFEAALEAEEKTGKPVVPEIMVPLVATRSELARVKQVIDQVAGEVANETGKNLTYQVGTMIELPRAALRAEEIAREAEFFSFGTNDLTQTTFGVSRDDAARFLGNYVAKGVLENDPFITLDLEGVGELVAMAARRGKRGREQLKMGICGEHGGDPASIKFCAQIGLDYVSCSPFRVPIARLAAAQAELALAAERSEKPAKTG